MNSSVPNAKAPQEVWFELPDIVVGEINTDEFHLSTRPVLGPVTAGSALGVDIGPLNVHQPVKYFWLVEPFTKNLVSMRTIMATSKGFSVAEMLVSIAILGILMVGNMSMQASQASATRALSEKLAVLDLQRSLSGLLAKTDVSSVCHGVMTNPLTNQNTTFNPPTSFPATSVLNLNNIPLSQVSGAPDLVKLNQAIGTSNNLIIQSITVDFVSDQTAGTYPANLNIAFVPTSTVQPMKNLILPIYIQTIPIPGSNSVKVSGCGANSSTSNANATVLIPPYNPAMLASLTNNAENYLCPAQGAMTGLVINTTGTCQNNCNGDGPIISSIQAYCGGVQTSGNSVLVGSNQTLARWLTGAADFQCPQGQIATGLVVNTAGTCKNNCNGDGPIIKSIQLRCAAGNVAGSPNLVPSNTPTGKYPLFKGGAGDLMCASGSVMVGIKVNTAGTCKNQCNGDGPIIQSIQIYCMPAS